MIPAAAFALLAVKTARGRDELPLPSPYPQQTVNKIGDNLLCYTSNYRTR